MTAPLTFEFHFARPAREAAAEPGQPMRLLLMGDFSNGAPATPLARRAALQVDVDNLDQAIARLAPALSLPLDSALDGADAPPVDVHLGALDDFHPDQLFQTAAFQALREQRERLKNPATFAAAAAPMRAGAASIRSAAHPASTTTTTTTPATPADIDSGADFASLLGGTAQRASAPRTTGTDFDAMIRQLVGTVPGADPMLPAYIAATDAVIGRRMRALLHDPAFQRLEAAWRGAHLLVSGLRLDHELQLHIVDIGKQELRDEIERVRAAGGDLRQSALYPLLVDAAGGDAKRAPWSALIGQYSFGPGADDVQLLAAMGALAAQAGAPFIAAASETLLGCADIAAHPDPADWQALEPEAASRWQALRASPAAGWLGLALPRMLLRLPYGKQSDALDQFEFEEYDGDHAGYLWGNPACACALLLGRSFEEQGWDMRPGDDLELDDLPAHTVRRDGVAAMQACAENFLSERAGEAILAQGLMPLLSFKNRNAARLLRSQSLASPPQPLSGPWQN